MTNINSHDRDEERLATLLRGLEADAPPPDIEFLAALRERSTDVFAASDERRDSPSTAGATLVTTAREVKANRAMPRGFGSDPGRSSPMMTLALRGLISLSASAVIAATWLLMTVPSTLAGAVPFSEIVSALRRADTLRFQLVKPDAARAEIWVRAPGLVRKEESPQRYAIATGSRLWRVDEAANTVHESDSPWFRSPDQQIDLVGLLEVGVSDASALLSARPLQRERIDGRDCFVYVTRLQTPHGMVSLEAAADVETRRLLHLTAWEGDLLELRANAKLIDQKPPLAELKLVAINMPVADDKFIVAKSLTEDGRIGKVSDTQGIVGLRPVLAKRWTPVCRELLLKPGDWLRTELRGANAVKVTLSSDVELTLGPGSLIECISPTRARLHTGQVQVKVPVPRSSPHVPREEPSEKPAADSAKTSNKDEVRTSKARHAERDGYILLAPREGQRVFKPGDKQLVRVDRDEKFVDVPQTPIWLAGFEGATNNESLGSLIVNLPDGRNEPLTVGYHKVSVEIRDQIARTTIEESFVNHTPSRLEGIFHFPLPQDASISGFGMWIGNKLVEADIVEKQRAREIYETILREKRDPGLLEWTGGNIFKARVFPIEAHSEKRVKIVYTQVLPLRANRYRYSYGLRSELLRTKPLRELSLSVTVNSALPLKNVTCPTHPARITVGWDQLAQRATAHQATRGGPTAEAALSHPTGHSAQVEFAAQEYTPTRDFEVVCEIDGRQSDVVVVPHRRGDDGYLLLQLTPPAPEGNWQRELLPDGQPLSLLLLCDTSQSMDSEKRKQQSDFVATILASLGEADRFQLACADVGTVWAFAEPVAATAENVAKARVFLDERVSLGWTNLDRAFDDVFKKATTGTHIIYIGDGIVSSGDTDPAAFVKRLAQGQGARGEGRENDKNAGSDLPSPRTAPLAPQPSLHAIGVGNSFESIVLKGIAAVGSGSVRNIGGEQTPQIVATELLNEIAQPGLRDLNVEFRGVRVAAMYPERLPNVPAGTQQILVGRYLPTGNDQTGEVIVTGMRGSEKVRYVARVNFKDAEDGNSFIPRLWARGHLDRLLAQGQSQAIQDDIIRLSEEFHIITPYTSLLVLETDADRERFGVKRRYEMRDGERFFAEGRDNANFDLRQQQMKRAGDWRLGLRRRVLRELAMLGRNPQAFQRQMEIFGRGSRLAGWSYNTPMSGPVSATLWDSAEKGYFIDQYLGVPVDGGGFLSERDRNELRSLHQLGNTSELSDLQTTNGTNLGDKLAEFDGLAAAPPKEQISLAIEDRKSPADIDGEFEFAKRLAPAEWSPDGALMADDYRRVGLEVNARFLGSWFDRDEASAFAMGMSSKLALGGVPYGGSFDFGGGGFGGRMDRQGPDHTAWVNTLFPPLAAAPGKPTVLPLPETWSPEAIALSKSLLRLDALQKLDGGIELRRVADTFDVRWERRSGRNTDLVLYSPKGWLTRPLDANDHTVIEFCDERERGVLSLSHLLGRVRASVAQELQIPPLALADFSLGAIHETYRGYIAEAVPDGDGRAKLVLKTKDGDNETVVGELLIDTAKNVLLKIDWFADGKVTHTTTFSDFIEVAESWWAKTVTTTDAKGRTTSVTKLDITARSAEQMAARRAEELSARPRVQFLRLPFVRLSTARQRVADGSATFDDRLTMILHNAQLQQWDELWKHVDAAEKLASDKPGVRWMRTILLTTIRRNEEARQRLLVEAKQLAAKTQQDELHLAEFVFAQAYPIMSWPEFLEFVQILKPVYERAPADLDMMPQWQERLANSLEAVGRHEESLALRRTYVEKSPWHIHWQTDFANRLARAGQFDAALAWLQKEIDRPIERDVHEDDTLRSAKAELLRTHGRWADLLKFTTDWVARKPESWSYNSGYAQHLSALIYNNQLDTAYSLVEQWFREARIDGKLTPDQRARLEIAINFANGQCYNLSFQRPDERWFQEIADTIRFFLRHKHHADIGSRGIGQHYFQQSDIADRLRGDFLTLLRTELNSLAPSQINTLLGWTLSGRMELVEPLTGRRQMDALEVPFEIWTKVAADLKARWLAEQDRHQKHLLSESLRSIYAARFADKELLPFLRERLAAAHPDYRASYRSTLFDTLLSTKWSDAIEQEAFTLLPELSEAQEPTERLAVQLPALHRLVDAMLANRQSAAESQLSDQGEQHKLTRQELAAKKAEFRQTARTQLAARLDEQSGHLKLRADFPFGALVNWLRIEQTWLDVQLDQNLPQVEEFCWQVLGEAPPRIAEPDNDEPADEAVRRQQQFEALLRQRAFTTVMNLAARRNAAEATIARVLKFIDAGIEQNRNAAPGVDAELVQRIASVWRSTKFHLLIALDRPDDLDRELRAWIRDDVSTAPWRQMLARLVAERGQIDEAIQLFEACRKDKLLSADDFRMLADWYLVTNRRPDYERARIDSYKLLPENSLSNRINQVSNRWSRGGSTLPSELDEDTLFVLQALFEKSAHPENYLWQHSNLYSACRDFRVLRVLPDAMLGRTPQQIYSYLQTLQNAALGELRSESPADEILTRINQLRASRGASAHGRAAPNENGRGADATPLAVQVTLTTTDLRALDLLEALVERKSSEVLNQPGPHVEACVAALRRAFDREWSNGEPRMMSNFLAHLGGLPNPKLQDEQLRELRELQRQASANARDHLHITVDLCNLLFWHYGQREPALREMEATIRAYTQTHDGVWPHFDHVALSSYVGMLEGANQHAAGETVLKNFLAKPEHDDQRNWLRDRLMGLYNHALEHNGAVSLGTGRAQLFGPLVQLHLRDLAAAPDENVRYNLVTRIVATFDIGRRHNIPGTSDAVRSFAFDTIPALLKQQTSQYRNTATQLTYIVAQTLGPKAALRYIVERMEQYPQWLEIGWENSWGTFGYELARYREEASNAKLGIADLEPRVLKLTLSELKRFLRTGESRNQSIYAIHHNYYWSAKADDFARAAEEVLAERRTSGRRATRVAHYLWHGLHRRTRAIEILLVAHRDGLLDESWQSHLVNWLHEEKRWAESISLLEPMMRLRPDNMAYRAQLMQAYFHSQRPQQLTELVAQTEQHFHEGGRWTEGNISQLAHACAACDLHEKAVGYFTESIALIQRNVPAHGSGNTTLSSNYQALARSHSALGHTREAVDAASAAIVVWGRTSTQRAHALEALRDILRNAKDLDDFVKHLDSEAEKSGQDSPILRKAIGQTYQSREAFAPAIKQFQLALALQPHDQEIHQALIACFDATKNSEAATRQLLALIDLRRHELPLYQQLAERLKDNQAEAERAATSIIESSPNEAESHAAMAELRQKQNRWSEAIPHWQQVAELRRLEPTGLLKLAEAQLHEKQWDAARQSIEKLQKTEWPSRFSDVFNQTRQLQERLPKESRLGTNR